MKRFATVLCLLLVFLFSASVVSHRPSDAENSVPAGWTGVYDREGLEAISSAPEKKYILMNDIDLSAAEWNALCSEESPFTGVFDGNGFTVYGMTVSHTVNPCGLFSFVSEGTVENLSVIGSSTGPVAGLIAGKISGGALRNCSVRGTVTSSYYGGGICGQIRGQGVTLSQCSSAATLSGTGATESELILGGICGGVYGTGLVLSDCSFTGSFSPTAQHLSLGGIAGEVNGGEEGIVSLAGCSAVTDLTLTEYETASAGGIAGRLTQGTLALTFCSFEGSLKGSDCSGIFYAGGIAGRAEGTQKIEILNCTSAGQISLTGHPDYQYSDVYRCVTCAVSLGEAKSESSGMVVGHHGLDVDYCAYGGGILGSALADGGTVRVAQCVSSISFQSAGTPVVVGGIVGMNRSETGTALVEDCLSRGEIRDASPVHGEIASVHGGVVGFHGGSGEAILRRCVSFCEMSVDYFVASGAVTGIASPYYGIEPLGTVSVSHCYVFHGAVDANALALSGVQMANPETFETFDFTSIWQIHPVTGLPDLRQTATTLENLPLGDVNGNGRVTRSDGVLLMKYLSGNCPLTEQQLLRADTDGSGWVDSRDVTVLLQTLIS